MATSEMAIEASGDEQVTGFQDWAAGQGIQVPAVLPAEPSEWFATRYPKLAAMYGPAVLVGNGEEDAPPMVKDLSEDFLAATLGEMATPESPTVFVPQEERFYRYDPDAGIFVEIRESRLLAMLSEVLLACGRDCASNCDTTNLLFRLRDTANLRGVVQRARGLLEVTIGYFESNLRDYIACRNGMLRLANLELLPFAAAYRRRNKLMVD